MANTLASGALGVLFWVVAARQYGPEHLGVDGALIALIITLSSVSELNLTNVLVRFLPEASRPGRVIATSYGLSAATAVAVALGALAVAPRISGEFALLSEGPLLALAWVGTVVVWSIFSLQDAALTGLRLAHWVPVENAVFGALKLAALLVLGLTGLTHGILLAWLLPLVAVVPAVNALISRRAVPAHSPSHTEGVVRRFGRQRLRRFLALDYASSVFQQVTYVSLPILVMALLGAEQNAYFSVAFAIVLVVDLLALNLATALTVEAASAGGCLADLTRVAGRRFLLIVAPLIALLILAAPVALLPFGEAYVEHASTLLRLLAAASLPRAAVVFYTAIRRSQGRGTALLLTNATECLLVIALLGLMGSHLALTGIGIGWLIVNAAIGLAVLPSVIRSATRAERPPESPMSRENPQGRLAVEA